MRAEGTEFRPNVNVGVDVTVEELEERYDAVVLATGATAWRDLPIPGRELSGIYQAMEFLPLANRVQEGDLEVSPINVAGKHVVIIGGGDTGADCLGTATRQGAASIQQLELLPKPPDARASDNPWPQWPNVYRVSSAHEEAGERLYAVSTERFVGEGGHVTGLEAASVEVTREGGRMVVTPKPGSSVTLKADLVLLAMGLDRKSTRLNSSHT